MVAGIAGGVIGALGLVGAALLFRPDSPPSPAPVAEAAVATPPPAVPEAAPKSAAEPAADTLAAPAPTTAPAQTAEARPDPAAPAAPLADAALATVTSVRLRVGPGFPADRQAAIVAALQAAGLPTVQVEALPFAITTSRVGYYRPDDLPAAEALGRIVGPLASDGGPAIGVRDYGRLLSDAAPGRLDLWVGG